MGYDVDFSWRCVRTVSEFHIKFTFLPQFLTFSCFCSCLSCHFHLSCRSSHQNLASSFPLSNSSTSTKAHPACYQSLSTKQSTKLTTQHPNTSKPISETQRYLSKWPARNSKDPSATKWPKRSSPKQISND